MKQIKNKKMKILNLSIIAVIILLASTGTVFAQAETATNEETIVISQNTETLSIKVKGVTCSSDLKTIATSLEKLDGVVDCKTGKAGPTSTFEISYNPTVIKLEDIHAAIENTGGCKNPNDRPYKIKL